jgi:Flp pilus assembly protein TadD
MKLSIPLALMAVVCCARAGPLQDAEKELFAARYKNAARLYAAALQADPAESSAYDGLVRSLIENRRSREAYAVGAEALQKNPQTPGAQTAAGRAAFRSGDIGKAEEYFRAALKLDPGYAGALIGLASVEMTVSRFKTARGLLLAAWRSSPGDPKLMIAHAGTLQGTDRIAALEEALAILDPHSDEARGLRARIADDLAIGGRQLRRLTSPYVASRIQLSLDPGPTLSVLVQLNRRYTVRLRLDTGASGIQVSSDAARFAGLEKLGGLSVEGRGLGDEPGPSMTRHLASEVRIGDVVFADYPISVSQAGLIGADVFGAFLVTIDTPQHEISLAPRADGPPPASAGPADAASEPNAGFCRAFRFRHFLAVPTFVNGGRGTLFVIDTGSPATLLDYGPGREYSAMPVAGRGEVSGVQGNVDRVSRVSRVSLAFAGFRQQDLSLDAISLEDLSDSMGAALGGILGLSSFGQLALTLDYREGTVRFEHRK